MLLERFGPMNASLLIVITLTAIQDALVGLVAQRVPAPTSATRPNAKGKTIRQ